MISELFMETMTIRELVGCMTKSDGKILEFRPERLQFFMEALCRNSSQTRTVIPIRKMCPHCESERLTVTDDCPDDHVLCLECIKVIDVEDLICAECGGEKFCDYGYGEDVRTEACEICNMGADEPDDDRI